MDAHCLNLAWYLWVIKMCPSFASVNCENLFNPPVAASSLDILLEAFQLPDSLFFFFFQLLAQKNISFIFALFFWVVLNFIFVFLCLIQLPHKYVY